MASDPLDVLRKTTRTAKKVKRKSDQMARKAQDSGDSVAKRRSIINPLWWVGIALYMFGVLICLTIIGIPFGRLLMSWGKGWMYKG